MDTTISGRAVLVSLSVSTWSARKYDRVVTAQINRDHAAVDSAGRYNKSLLPQDNNSYKTLMKVAGALRTEHYKNTLAWSDEGWRLLPTANYQDYTDMVRDAQNTFSRALSDFLSDYPGMQQSAQHALNGMYRAADYPDASVLRDKFSIGCEYLPVPTEGDFRLDLTSDTILDIEKSVTDRVERATHLAVKDSWQRLHDCVAHIHDRLSDPDAIFRDSLIENAKGLTAILKRLNVTNDVDLETARAMIEAQLSKHSPDDLRKNPNVRAQVAVDAQDIMTKMKGMYGSAAPAPMDREQAA